MLDNSKKFNDLRKQYNTFIYDSFLVENTEEEIIIKFKFIIENLTSFEPELRILKNNLDKKIDDKLIENCKNAAFHMGLIELISYWKATCSPNVIIKAGYINEEQINWFKKLYFYGLGELFYTNGIKTNIDDFMSVKCESNEVYDDTINTSILLVLASINSDWFSKEDVKRIVDKKPNKNHNLLKIKWGDHEWVYDHYKISAIEPDVFLWSSLISTIFVSLMNVLGEFQRMATFYDINLVVSIPRAVGTLKKRDNFIVSIIIIVLFIVYFLYFQLDNWNIRQYRFFWQ